jgi:hypothetical protein
MAAAPQRAKAAQLPGSAANAAGVSMSQVAPSEGLVTTMVDATGWHIICHERMIIQDNPPNKTHQANFSFFP